MLKLRRLNVYGSLRMRARRECDSACVVTLPVAMADEGCPERHGVNIGASVCLFSKRQWSVITPYSARRKSERSLQHKRRKRRDVTSQQLACLAHVKAAFFGPSPETRARESRVSNTKNSRLGKNDAGRVLSV